MSESELRVDGREERGDRTARALVSAGRAAFAARGFAGASVRDIARAADANPALIRYHFGSKEGLYQRVVRDALEAMRERLVGAFEIGGTLREKLDRVIDVELDYLAQDRDFPRLIQRALMDSEEQAETINREYIKPTLDSVRLMLASGFETPIGGVNDMFITMFAAVMGPFIYAPMLGEAFGEDLLAPDAIERRKTHLKNFLAAAIEVMTPK